jgi:hypothetical protein
MNTATLSLSVDRIRGGKYVDRRVYYAIARRGTHPDTMVFLCQHGRTIDVKPSMYGQVKASHSSTVWKLNVCFVKGKPLLCKIEEVDTSTGKGRRVHGRIHRQIRVGRE